MPGKPHKTSFPEKAFTVKDGKSLNSELECLNLASIFTVSSTANLFRWPAIATDSCCDVFIPKSIRYVSFSIAGDSPRRTSIHSHSIINWRLKPAWTLAFMPIRSGSTVTDTVKLA
ncbi:hypothetical protein [Cupriavidus necator]|uniref:hypothetical protein n=1 Tax=Cupriavidus necator TaxID=106590 RepID=UPI00339D7C04